MFQTFTMNIFVERKPHSVDPHNTCLCTLHCAFKLWQFLIRHSGFGRPSDWLQCLREIHNEHPEARTSVCPHRRRLGRLSADDGWLCFASAHFSSKENYQLTSCQGAAFFRSFSHSVVSSWYRLPEGLKESAIFWSFKRALLAYLASERAIWTSIYGVFWRSDVCVLLITLFCVCFWSCVE